MKKILFPILFSLTCSYIMAQTVKMEVDTDTNMTNNYGPNQRNYIHTYFSYGFIPMAGQNGALTNPLKNSDIIIGVRYKRKWSEVLSSGADLAYQSQIFRLKQTPGKVLPDTISNEKESLIAYSFQAEIYQRFNFGNRGDVVGTFLDIGAGINFLVRMQHETVNTLPNKVVLTVNEKNLPYNQKNYFHLMARLGYNRWMIYAQYRLNPLINQNMGYPDLPPLSIGFQIGFY